MHADAIAIFVRRGRGNDGPHRHFGKAPDPPQRLLDLPGLDRELLLVGEMLVAASTTASEVRAGRFDPIRRRLIDGNEICFGEFFFLLHHAHRDDIARRGERHEEHLAIVTRDAFSAEGDVGDGELEQFVHGKKKRLPLENGSPF